MSYLRSSSGQDISHNHLALIDPETLLTIFNVVVFLMFSMTRLFVRNLPLHKLKA